jgi:hypothetical protein
MAKPTAFENWLLVIVLVIGLGISVGPVIWGHFRRAVLHDSGLLAQATVLEFTDTGRRHNSNPVMQIKLRVTLPEGKENAAEVTMPMSPVRIAAIKPGMVVKVRVDAANPANVTLAED